METSSWIEDLISVMVAADKRGHTESDRALAGAVIARSHLYGSLQVVARLQAGVLAS